MGKKWWPRHHEFSSLAMQSSNDIIFENTSDFDHPPKISAPAPSQSAKKNKKKPTLSATKEKAKKKEQLLEWAKKMRIDDVTLNETKTDVVSLGPAAWETLSKEVKSAVLKENGIKISQE